MVYRILWVGLGGFFGAVSRYLVSGWVQSASQARFPLGTLTVNVVGSFALGFLGVVMIEQGSARLEARLLLLTGVLGSFTTFSTFSYESINLIRDGFYVSFVGNVGSNLVFCLVGALLGAPCRAGRRLSEPKTLVCVRKTCRQGFNRRIMETVERLNATGGQLVEEEPMTLRVTTSLN